MYTAQITLDRMLRAKQMAHTTAGPLTSSRRNCAVIPVLKKMSAARATIEAILPYFKPASLSLSGGHRTKMSYLSVASLVAKKSAPAGAMRGEVTLYSVTMDTMTTQYAKW